jgi:FAD/FMN-containing dehydrogenase
MLRIDDRGWLRMIVSGWGRFPIHDGPVARLSTTAAVREQILTSRRIVPRGNGRSYGDAAIGAASTLELLKLDRFLEFDRRTGRVRAEAGLLLADLLEIAAPLGLLPHAVPGTKYVTTGGMIACDVHGKNHHHAGGFTNSLLSLKLLLPSGETVECSPDREAQLFFATIGGMGLTGVILEAEFQLARASSGWIVETVSAAPHLDAAFELLAEGNNATYCVAWVDCLATGPNLGRALVITGEHATAEEASTLPGGAFPGPLRESFRLAFDFPALALNRLSVTAFNEAYFRRGLARAGRKRLRHWDEFFFPLDRIREWRRLYGRRGFLQHQSVLPEAKARAALGEMLMHIAAAREGSFLCVLKRLGGGRGDLSFPMDGYTFALDFPVKASVFGLLDRLDEVVVAAGGRIYLAKDARQSRQTFETGYPALGRFRETRRQIGASGVLVSKLSERLGI